MNRILALALAVAAVFSGAPAAHAEWPERRITIVVQSAAGGSPDILARIVGEHISKRVGQPVVILNVPGGAGNIAMGNVANSPPDGYTILGAADSLAINQSLFKSLPYSLKSFTPVIQAISTPQVLVINDKAPIQNLKEFIAAAKAEPGKLDIASPAMGTIGHLGILLLQKQADIQVNPVVYRSAQPALTDVLGKHVHALMVTLAPALPFIRDGRLRAVAVSTERRSPSLPDVPTFIESGIPGYSFDSWQGYLVPVGTPRDVIDKLNREINAVLMDPVVRQQLLDQAFDPIGGTPGQFERLIAQSHEMWGKIIRDQNIQVE